MSDIVERAQAALLSVSMADVDNELREEGSEYRFGVALGYAVGLLPELITEVTELRSELKWVNA